VHQENVGMIKQLNYANYPFFDTEFRLVSYFNWICSNISWRNTATQSAESTNKQWR